MLRRGLLASLATFGATLVVATPAMAQDWYEDQRRRRAYERWREREWHRRERDARRRRQEWRRDQWAEEREREAWARRQRWYR